MHHIKMQVTTSEIDVTSFNMVCCALSQHITSKNQFVTMQFSQNFNILRGGYSDNYEFWYGEFWWCHQYNCSLQPNNQLYYQFLGIYHH